MSHKKKEFTLIRKLNVNYCQLIGIKDLYFHWLYFKEYHNRKINTL